MWSESVIATENYSFSETILDVFTLLLLRKGWIKLLKLIRISFNIMLQNNIYLFINFRSFKDNPKVFKVINDNFNTRICIIGDVMCAATTEWPWVTAAQSKDSITVLLHSHINN